MEGFLCPTLLRQSIQNFLRTSNFSDFVGGWNCDFGVDTAEKLFYLVRTDDLDWLEVVVRYSEKIISQKFVGCIPRQESKREAAARLLDAHVRSQIYYSFPVPPYRKGLLTSGELENIVRAVADEFERNSRAAQKRTRGARSSDHQSGDGAKPQSKASGLQQYRMDRRLPAQVTLDNDLAIAE